MLKVLFLNFIPSPYRLAFFEDLGQKCELTVLFERKNSNIRKGHWDSFSFNNYKGVILKGITIGGHDKLCFNVIKYLKNNYDRIIIANPTSPTGILAAFILRKKKIPYYVESDGSFPTGRTNGIKYFLKRFVMANAFKCFSTAKLHDEYYMECGVKNIDIIRYPFTSISYKDIVENTLTTEEKRAVRDKLGISQDRMILSIGQFVHRKGFDILLNAAKLLKKDIAIVIIGGVPTEQYLKIVSDNKLDNVYFIDFISKNELKVYFSAADLFVLPTRYDIWGLVINEAMSQGLPVISTKTCIAATELIREGENGFLYEAEDCDSLKYLIDKVIYDQEFLNQASYASLSIIKNYTIESMSDCHIKNLMN